uniref:Uncharacterized protein n=1 Tax=Trypanosoma congolense (strain IL3000) TaxID=1068625 RepID=G0V0E6_TRYCI|nr:conserved hypothetical protein [Trypanosoma congolense IL3000]
MNRFINLGGCALFVIATGVWQYFMIDWMRFDNFLEKNENMLPCAVPNGDSHHINFLLREQRTKVHERLSRDGGASNDSAGGDIHKASVLNDGLNKSVEFTSATHRSVGAMAVFLAGDFDSHGHGSLTAKFTQRLLYSLRVALLTGSPWLIISCSAEERANIENILWNVRSPGNFLFPNKFLAILPPSLREVAKQMRDSMSFASSLSNWTEGGDIIEHLSSRVDSEDNGKPVVSPRVLRHGRSRWIVPEIVLISSKQLWSRSTETEFRDAVYVFSQRFITSGLYDYADEASQQKNTEFMCGRKGVFDVFAVGSMFNERYQHIMLAREFRRLKYLHPHDPIFAQRKHGKKIALWLAENVNVLTASSPNSPPEWLLPSPLFVTTAPDFVAVRRGWWFLRPFAPLAHIIYFNYCRWIFCLRCTISSYLPCSFVSEAFSLAWAILTERCSLIDLFQVS